MKSINKLITDLTNFLNIQQFCQRQINAPNWLGICVNLAVDNGKVPKVLEHFPWSVVALESGPNVPLCSDVPNIFYRAGILAPKGALQQIQDRLAE